MPQTDEWEEEEPVDRRYVYEKVVNRLYYNTGGAQPPLATRATIRRGVVFSGEGLPVKAVNNALQKTRQDGKIFRWKHPNEGRHYLGIDDPEILREKVASYAERISTPRTDLIGVANQRIDHHVK